MGIENTKQSGGNYRPSIRQLTYNNIDTNTYASTRTRPLTYRRLKRMRLNLKAFPLGLIKFK